MTTTEAPPVVYRQSRRAKVRFLAEGATTELFGGRRQLRLQAYLLAREQLPCWRQELEEDVLPLWRAAAAKLHLPHAMP
jgi:hypothetical protein